MSKLDDILSNHGFQVVNAQPDDTLDVVAGLAKSEFKALMLELIGEDEPARTNYYSVGGHNPVKSAQNKLRAELRKKVEDL